MTKPRKKGMSTVSTTQQFQEERLRLLDYAYQCGQKPRGQEWVMTEQAVEALNIPEHHIESHSAYLVDKGLLRSVVDGGVYAITAFGIDVIENAATQGGSGNPFFSPQAINNVYVQSMSNSMIQQGTSNSTQTGNWRAPASTELAEFIGDIRGQLSELSLSDEDRESASKVLEVIELQTHLGSSSSNVVQQLFQSLRSILEKASGTVLANQMIQRINDFFR
jgi:hypothetical protein